MSEVNLSSVYKGYSFTGHRGDCVSIVCRQGVVWHLQVSR